MTAVSSKRFGKIFSNFGYFLGNHDFTKQKYCNIFCVMSVYKKTLFFSEFYQDTIDLLYKKYHTEKKFLSTFFLRFFYT